MQGRSRSGVVGVVWLASVKTEWSEGLLSLDSGPGVPFIFRTVVR